MEDFPSPPTYGLQQVGTLTSDGSSYTFYKHQQVNQPSIVSQSSTFWQYISIRASPRTSGTVTVANHFNAWAKAGLNLGSMNYQIISVESYGGGSGSASITVSQGSSSPSSSSTSSSASSSSASTQPGTTSSQTSPVTSPTGTCSAIYGQCGGSGWTVNTISLFFNTRANVLSLSGPELLLVRHL
jgi:endo-1,4-beta-xylanase